MEAAPDDAQLIRTARMVNDAQPKFAVDLVRRALGGELNGRSISALGLSYKPDVDDLRESPAIEVARQLAAAGAKVTAFEPFKLDLNLAGLETVNSIDEAVAQAEVLVLLVNHTALRSINPHTLAGLTPARVAVDTVNGWNSENWQAAGFKVFRLGVNS